MDTQVADTLPGSLVDGRYRIRGRVASGGMATVYTAVDERLERTVALKIIHPAQARHAQAHLANFLKRFTDEAKTVARLTHPNVVAVYDQGTHAGLPYLVMEYVRGRTLREILAERRRLDPGEALAIFEQILAALAAAHRAGLIHRDIKPENVLVAESPTGGAGNLVDSVVKVADFGLARAVAASADDESGGQVMATVAYVAPELVADGHADARSDVYSAGIMLFEMLTGRVPYDGDRAVDVAWQHVDRDVPPPSKIVAGLPAVLDNLVGLATRRNPAARPTDAGALLSEVQTVRDDLGNANVHTTLLRPVAQPTMVVAAVPPPERPSWARLPEVTPARSQPHRRRAEARSAGAAEQLRTARDRVLGDPRNRKVVLAAAVVLALVVAVGGWWFGFGRYTQAPQLVGMPKAQAASTAADAGFTVSYEERYDENVAKDVVLSQNPPSDARILKGDTITLVLSLGPERYAVPDVVGMTFDLAEVELTKAKLTVVKGPARYNDNLPAGVVVDVNPKVGAEVKPGDKVTVTVSKGKAPLTVPNLVGKSITEARAILQQLGLVPRETYKESDKPKDQVIAQSPADGSGVEKGAEVKLDVSQGPPAVVVPRVIDMPCDQGKATLEALGLPVQVVNPNPALIVRLQNPAENSQVPPGTGVMIWCG